MQRRDFLKIPLVLPVIGLIPSIATAKDFTPKTADELYDAINSLGYKHPDVSLKSYEKIGSGDKMRRYTHKVYALASNKIKGDTEADLVRYMWTSMKEMVKQHSNKFPNIIWRKHPKFRIENVDINFDNGKPEKLEKRAYLSMRLSIGHNGETSNFKPFVEKPEGEQMVILSA